MVRGLVEKMRIQISKNILVAVIIIICLILIQTIMYESARFLCGEPTLLTSRIDEHTPFLTVFIYPYISWYPMLFLIPLIIYIAQPKNLYSYAMTNIIVVVFAFIIFVAFPTTVNRPEVNVTDFTSFVTYLIFYTDTPPTCCLPSTHCALCFMFILYTINIKELKPGIRALIAIWSLVIVISTLYIKQHVIYDILGALILVLVSHIICKRFKLYKITEKAHNRLLKLLSKD